MKFIGSFFKILFFLYVYSNDSLCHFNFVGKTVPYPSTDICMVAQFCCSSVFFPQIIIIIAELNLIELSKQKCDTCEIQIDFNLYTKSYLRDLKGF